MTTMCRRLGKVGTGAKLDVEVTAGEFDQPDIIGRSTRNSCNCISHSIANYGLIESTLVMQVKPSIPRTNDSPPWHTVQVDI
jgi:hypothetical protein